ncbi:hypothetical protein HDU76_004522 [Blyttiomyces sp. JEL0837]|nr:hypothetical protein HDU76_004522 [Blyttiomyces sp. JEL0837]
MGGGSSSASTTTTKKSSSVWSDHAWISFTVDYGYGGKAGSSTDEGEGKKDHAVDPVERYVLFALDGTEHSVKALEWGLQNLAIDSKCRLVLLNVGEIEADVSDVLYEAMGKHFTTLQV